MRIETTSDKAKYARVREVEFERTGALWKTGPGVFAAQYVTDELMQCMGAKFETDLEAPEGYELREALDEEVDLTKIPGALHWKGYWHDFTEEGSHFVYYKVCKGQIYAIPLKPKQPSVVEGKVMGVPLEGFIKTSLDELTEVYVVEKARAVVAHNAGDGLAYLKACQSAGNNVSVLVISEEG